MKGDFSRFTFQRDRHYNSVRMQQGRVQLDADWNEQVDILAYLRNTEARDVIGASGVPHAGGGFLVSANGDNLTISGGRMYVDGMLVENESTVFYKVQVNQASQPHYPVPADWHPDASGIYLAYLDVWQRHMTALEDPAIREVALGGPDTATRTQVIWQVRLLPLPGLADTLSCWEAPSAWENMVARARGRLGARTQVAETEANPCVLPAGAGYRRLENQLYRVEIHDPGVAGTATFKWSRDNGMVVTRLLKINAKVLTVADTGRDAVLGFIKGQWVEVSDEPRLLRGEPGVMVCIADVNENIIVIEAWSQSAPDSPPPLDMETATLRRWDHTGSAALAVVGSNYESEDWIDLEDGVQVRFESSINYETGDYWLIPARTVSAETLGGDIEWPRDPDNAGQPAWLPPHGIDHHYARLALVTWDGEAFEDRHDCRPLFPALTEPDLYYISGDGQEAMPGERLPQRLRVGVVNCNRPIEGAWVKLAIVRGNGTLEVDTTPAGFTIIDGTVGAIKAFLARTDANGEIGTFWRLEELADLENAPDQLLQATLLRTGVDSPANYLDVPVLFGASFGVAWENQYGGARFPDEQHEALRAITVEQALDQLRENVALYYVSGDSQWIAPGPRAAEGDGEAGATRIGLPDPLEVRVANGDWPYAGAQVEFAIETGDGSLSPEGEAGDVTTLTVNTDADGIAHCYWALDRNVPKQRVTATLVSAGDLTIISPSRITFSAQLASADQISYDGSDFPDHVHASLVVETVEEALDQLRENTALHYVGGDGQQVYPDSASAQPLTYPLQVRVANGQWPRPGAQLEFSVPSTDHGTLSVGHTSGTRVTAITGTDGVAQCQWTPNPNGPVSQQAVARLIAPVELVSTAANPLPGVIRFNATLNRADEVYYIPNEESLMESPPDRVQQAIDELYTMKVNRAGDTITGSLVIQGDLTVNGATTTVNTATLEVEDNIIRVNKYPPQPAPNVINGGLEVFRGGHAPNAQVLWDETTDHWKMGLEGALYDVAYGPNWETLTQGHIADALHRHRRLYASDTATASALSVDAAGNIGVGTETPQAKLHVDGNLRLAIGEGLEFRGDSNYFGVNQDARVIRMLDANASSGVVDGGIAIEGYTPTDNIRRPIMAIRGAGHVGIGINNPDARLHVVAPAADVAYYFWAGPEGATASHPGGATQWVYQELFTKSAADETFATIRNATSLLITNQGGAGTAHISGSGTLAYVYLYLQDANSGAWSAVRAWALSNTGTGAGATQIFDNQNASFSKRDVSGARIAVYLSPNTTVQLAGWNGMRFEFQSDHDAAIFQGRVGIGTASPVHALDVQGAAHVEGALTSSLWRAAQPINMLAGPLPRSASFTSGGGTLLVFASGSGWSAAGARQIGMEILIDAAVRGEARSFTNEVGSHKVFAANALLVGGVTAGSHSLQLRALANTSTDGNDFFSVTILELPWVQA